MKYKIQKKKKLVSNVISNFHLHQFFFAQKKQNPFQNISFRGTHQEEGGVLIKWNAILFLLPLVTPLDVNSLLLTKPSSKLSRKRKRKEENKEEEGQRKEIRVPSLWTCVCSYGERGVVRCFVQLWMLRRMSLSQTIWWGWEKSQRNFRLKTIICQK